MSDQEYLSTILDHETGLSEKFDAVKKILDEKVLAEVLLEARSAEIRSYALSLVDDQDTLVEVVKYDTNSTLRKFGLEKLEPIHHEVFEEIVENDPDPLVREEAVKKMPDFYHHQFARVLTNDPDSRVRHRAARRLQMSKLDQNELSALAKNAVDPYIRRAATYSISDEATLQEIAILGDDIQVIQHCIEQINSQEILKSIFQTTEFVATKLEVLPKINDQEFLRNIIKGESSEEVIRAVQRLLMIGR